MFIVNEQLQIKSIWFSKSPTHRPFQLFIYKDVLESNVKSFTLSKGNNSFGYTLVTDLTQDIESIKTNFKKTVRYEINKAVKLALPIIEKNHLTNDEFSLLNELYLSLKLRRVTGARISKYNKENIKVTSLHSNNKLICFHVYLYDSERTRLLYSACIKGKVEDIGYDSSFFNRYLHYKDIKMFKDLGLKKYDWGGISSPENPNGVDKFKMGFSGELTKIYTIYSPLLSLARKVKLL